MAIHGRLIVWFNAFLAKDIKGVSEIIQTGSYKGKTALRLPKYAKFPLNANKMFQDVGYLTDQRGFSNKLMASCRLQSIAVFELDTMLSLKVTHSTSGTVEVDIGTGEMRRWENADLSGCKASQLFQADYDRIEAIRSSPPPDKIDWDAQEAVRNSADYFSAPALLGLTKVGMLTYIHGSASDPLVWGAPNLDYKITIAVGMDRPNDKLIIRCYGQIDGLVDCEAYAQYDNNTKTLVTREHNPSDTLTSLIGDADRYLQGGAMFTRSYASVSPQELPTQSPTRAPATRMPVRYA